MGYNADSNNSGGGARDGLTDLGTGNAHVLRQLMTNYVTGCANSKSIRLHAVWYDKEPQPLLHPGPAKITEVGVPHMVHIGRGH